MPSTFRHHKIRKEVPHSILDLYSEHVHKRGSALLNFSFSDLAPNAGAHLLPKAGAERTLEAVRCSPMLGFPYDDLDTAMVTPSPLADSVQRTDSQARH